MIVWGFRVPIFLCMMKRALQQEKEQDVATAKLNRTARVFLFVTALMTLGVDLKSWVRPSMKLLL